MECNGCSACAVVCSKNCIEMKLDQNGFLRPAIDKEKCIECGLCNKICSYSLERGKSLDEGRLYAAWSTNKEIRESTTSGGIGYLLAKEAIEENYIVCGVELDNYTLNAKHCICTNMEEIEKIKGSKYLQSISVDAFRELVQILKNDKNKKALLFGTPCQIAGMHQVFTTLKMRDRVVLVDIFCHGVPSKLLWSRYLKWLYNKKRISKDKIDRIVFRDKKFSWHTYYMHIWTDTMEYLENRNIDPFLKLFSMGVLNQKECFTCKFRNYTYADIRMGDYWGKRFENMEEGYSMIVTLSHLGNELFMKLRDMAYEPVHISERFGQQHTDYKTPEKYEKGFQMLKDNTDLDKIVNYFDPPITRIIRDMKKVIKRNITGM